MCAEGPVPTIGLPLRTPRGPYIGARNRGVLLHNKGTAYKSPRSSQKNRGVGAITKSTLIAAARTSRAAAERGELRETKLLTYDASPGRLREEKRQHLTVQCPSVGASRVEAEQRCSWRQRVFIAGYLFGSYFS